MNEKLNDLRKENAHLVNRLSKIRHDMGELREKEEEIKARIRRNNEQQAAEHQNEFVKSAMED